MPIFYEDFMKLEKNFGRLFSPRKNRNFRITEQKINKEKFYSFKQVKFVDDTQIRPAAKDNNEFKGKIRLSKKSGPRFEQMQKPLDDFLTAINNIIHWN